MVAPVLESLRDDLRELSAVKSVWIEDDEETLHVIVTGRTYPSVSNCLEKYKKNRGVTQIEHPDAEYTGEERHYVLSTN